MDAVNLWDYALLGRMEGEVPGYLSYSVEEGEVLCVFHSMVEADEFYERWRLQIPGGGWRAVRPEPEELASVLSNFEFVSISPEPTPGATEYLLPAEDFVKGVEGLG